eukprot:3037439-Pleurochrysis_carterae.AAC.1
MKREREKKRERSERGADKGERRQGRRGERGREEWGEREACERKRGGEGKVEGKVELKVEGESARRAPLAHFFPARGDSRARGRQQPQRAHDAALRPAVSPSHADSRQLAAPPLLPSLHPLLSSLPHCLTRSSAVGVSRLA